VFGGVSAIGSAVDVPIKSADQISRAETIARTGLDRLFWEQSGYFLGSPIRGDFGKSFGSISPR
jgi:ABC-type dipeptide/oligopeptide/nickel transport system permease component